MNLTIEIFAIIGMYAVGGLLLAFVLWFSSKMRKIRYLRDDFDRLKNDFDDLKNESKTQTRELESLKWKFERK